MQLRCRGIPLVLTALLLMLALSANAANVYNYKIGIPAGTTSLEIEGYSLVVEASAPIVLYLAISGDTITGGVESAPGVGSAVVTITLLGPPDTILFKGKVSYLESFRQRIYEETGRGEM